MLGPLKNFGCDFARDNTTARVSRSAQPSVEGWETLRLLCRQYAPPDAPLRLHHFALNGKTGPDWLESDVRDWSVFTPSVPDALVAAAMIGADLDSGRSVHICCDQGSDRTGYLWAVLRLRYFRWSFEQATTERALFLSAILIDPAMDFAIVEALRRIARMQ